MLGESLRRWDDAGRRKTHMSDLVPASGDEVKSGPFSSVSISSNREERLSHGVAG